MSAPGETEKPSGTVNPSYATATEGESAERLEWQSELDSAMTDLDSRLRHPRRRASDVGPQPTLPELGQFDVTQELLDEISWRVAEQLRRQAASFVPQGPLSVQAAGMLPNATTAVAPTPVAPSIPEGTAMVIRVRWPLFTWPFRRRRSRRRQSMLSLSDYRAT